MYIEIKDIIISLLAMYVGGYITAKWLSNNREIKKYINEDNDESN